MEDFFELLIIIVIAGIGIVNKSKKKKKANAEKAAASPVKAAKPAAEPAQPVSEMKKAIHNLDVDTAISAFSELLEDTILPDPDKPAAVNIPAAIETAVRKAAAPAKAKTSIEVETAKKQHLSKIKNLGAPALGESKTDDHGCIGGSMPEHEAEGETIAEHAQHEQNRRQKLAEESALSAASFRKPSAADLRRAVVMSEVLDKPVALRGRRI